MDSPLSYEILIEDNEAGIFQLQNDIIAYANHAFARVLGTTSQLIIGTSILKHVETESRQDLIEILEQFKTREKDTWSQNLPLNNGSEETAFFSMHLKVHSIKKGQVNIIGASRNSTERVRKKEELQKSKVRFEALFRNMLDAIIIYNYDEERISDFNDAAFKMFGYKTRVDFLKINRFGLIPKKSKYFSGFDLHEQTTNHGQRVMDGEAFQVLGVVINADQEEIIVSSNVVPTYQKYGEAFIIFHDITKRVLDKQAKKESDKRYRETIKAKNEELEKYIASNLQLENFAYFASHDLQTPLRSITSFTQLLERRLKGKLSEEEREFMGFITSSAINMQRLINDLLSYSRVNTTEIELIKINPEKLLSQLIRELAKSIEEKQADIIIQNLPDSILADQTKIRQVFQNLIANALKFSAEGVKPVVTINCKEQEDQWLFSVQDNGIGIEPEFQDKIFLLFKRLHTNTEYEGTGIGLAMVKKIIDQHQGQIGLDSTPGKGSTFWFTIKKSLKKSMTTASKAKNGLLKEIK